MKEEIMRTVQAMADFINAVKARDSLVDEFGEWQGRPVPKLDPS